LDITVERINFEVEADLVSGINRFALENKTTVDLILLAVYYVLLSKYSRQSDIVIGVPFSFRSHPELARVVGPLSNIGVMRNYPNDYKTFEYFLTEIIKNAEAAEEHSHYPLEFVLEKTLSEDEFKGIPLFEAMFEVKKTSHPDAKEIEHSVSTIASLGMQLPNAELKLFASVELDTFYFKLEYIQQLFHKDSMDRFGKDYLYILGLIIANKNIVLQDISLIASSMELQQIVLDEFELNFD
jgi:non-ribosomal peptide synthetase component F